MSGHFCGPHCSTARFLTKLTRTRVRLEQPRIIPVKSWCRICGVPVLLEVLNDYDMAVRHFYALDDTPMVHKGVHAESGGWGVSWRLDDVLDVVFLNEHMEALWPMAPWWKEAYGDPRSEDQGVVIMSQSDLSTYRDVYMDMELRLLEQYINGNPKDAFELKSTYEEVWSAAEVGSRYEILGFKSPFAIARCRETGEKGTLIFQNHPRFYFGWDPERLI
jgi:hypothetical protein